MAQDYQIRPALRNAGYTDADIGYDQNRNMVTLQGKDFLGGGSVKNLAGSTFTDKNAFTQALNSYKKSQTPQPTQTAATGYTPYSGTTQQPSYNTNSYSNPYDQQISTLLAALQQQAANPTTVDVNQIYQSPQYAAAQAQQQRAAHQATRAAQESLGSAGFGRSTALAERSQGIQNDANEYLQTQVLPVLMQQAQQAKQQQLQNQMNMLNSLMSQQGVYDNRYNNDRNFALNEGQLTGNYMPAGADELINTLLNLKSNTEQNWNSLTPEQRNAAQAEANQIRSQLGGMGIDSSRLGADVTADQARANAPMLGQRTLGAQQFDFQQNEAQRDQANIEADRAYRAARDAIEDERYIQEFDEDVRRFGLNYALNKAQLNHQISSSAASRALQSRGLDLEERALQLRENEANQPGSPAVGNLSPNQFLSSVSNLYTDPESGGITKNPTQREEMFLQVVDAGYDEPTTAQLLSALGLTGQEIDRYLKKYGG